MTIYGYARVSTDGQTLASQDAQLTAAGCAKIFSEKVSGAKTDRAEVAKVLKRLEPGDVLVRPGHEKGPPEMSRAAPTHLWLPKLSASRAYCDQPAALIRRHLILLDRELDGRLSIGRVVDDANELRGHVLDEDSPGIGLAGLS